MHKLKPIGDFVWFFLTFILVMNLISGDFWDILDWSTPGATGAAIVNVLALVGAVMFVREVLLPAIKKRKETKK